MDAKEANERIKRALGKRTEVELDGVKIHKDWRKNTCLFQMVDQIRAFRGETGKAPTKVDVGVVEREMLTNELAALTALGYMVPPSNPHKILGLDVSYVGAKRFLKVY